MKRCPNCGAPDKYPEKSKVDHSLGYERITPTTYTCGTTDSPNWSPPIYGKNCRSSTKPVLNTLSQPLPEKENQTVNNYTIRGHAAVAPGLRGHSLSAEYPITVIGKGESYVLFNVLTSEELSPACPSYADALGYLRQGNE